MRPGARLKETRSTAVISANRLLTSTARTAPALASRSVMSGIGRSSGSNSSTDEILLAQSRPGGGPVEARSRRSRPRPQAELVRKPGAELDYEHGPTPDYHPRMPRTSTRVWIAFLVLALAWGS